MATADRSDYWGQTRQALPQHRKSETQRVFRMSPTTMRRIGKLVGMGIYEVQHRIRGGTGLLLKWIEHTGPGTTAQQHPEILRRHKRKETI